MEQSLTVEHHGIEFVPLSERYGTPLRLFTIWFNVNLSVLCLAAGTLGIFAGLSLQWTIAALVLGNAIGTAFMAAHSAQGPHLGIPQMIQSRAQFGVLGAAIPLLAVVIEATLYTAANGVLVVETVKEIAPIGDLYSLAIFGGITLAIAYIGYEMIHAVSAWLALVSGAFFIVIVTCLISRYEAHAVVGAIHHGHFVGSIFLLVVTQATAWNLSSAPYVADYSRYLPSEVSVARAFWYTGLGNFLGATLIMCLGAYMAWIVPELARTPGEGLPELVGQARPLVSTLVIIGLLEVNVMNLYSAYMSTVTIFSGIRSVSKISLRQKFLIMLLLIVLATIVAAASRNRFDNYFSNLLSILLYVLIPWSAINLTDYYFVSRGRYSISDMFNVNGVYGAYRWKVIAIYCLSVVAQLPFVSLSFFTGPVARAIGADISWLPGSLLATFAYLAFVDTPAPVTMATGEV